MMKKSYLLIFFLSFLLKGYSQEPDFKFYLAFVDGSGAKDTIWVGWDSIATSGYDPIFNDTPQSLPNDSSFRVYIKYGLLDSGKVKINPYSNTMVGMNIDAQNHIYPITMYWDTTFMNQNSLPFVINQALLDNDWFFFNWNDPTIFNSFNMMITDSVQLPSFTWGSQNQFPIGFLMGYNPNVWINESNILSQQILILPNPASNVITVLTTLFKNNTSFIIVDITGKVVREGQLTRAQTSINLENLSNGVYGISLIEENGNVTSKQFIKN